MKRKLISSLVFLAIGFTGGWLFKSASTKLDPISNTVPSRENRPTVPPRTNIPLPNEISTEEKFTIPSSPVLPESSAKIELSESVEAIDHAKWLRLNEVLSLNSEQAKRIGAIIAEAKPTLDSETSVDAAYADAGTKLQEAIIVSLTEDQKEAFKELQARDKENRIESKIRESFQSELSNLDLTPEQRTQATAALRDAAEAQVSEVSDSTRLLLAGSFLPIGKERLTEDGVRMLNQLKPSPDSPLITIENIAARHVAEIEEKKSRMEGILTPGQLGIYQAKLEESLANLKSITSPE